MKDFITITRVLGYVLMTITMYAFMTVTEEHSIAIMIIRKTAGVAQTND